MTIDVATSRDATGKIQHINSSFTKEKDCILIRIPMATPADCMPFKKPVKLTSLRLSVVNAPRNLRFGQRSNQNAEVAKKMTFGEREDMTSIVATYVSSLESKSVRKTVQWLLIM
jgi:hypothetical protein